MPTISDIEREKTARNNPICVCDICGEQFGEYDLVETTYSEYPGAHPWTESVSPCCNSGWDYLE